MSTKRSKSASFALIAGAVFAAAATVSARDVGAPGKPAAAAAAEPAAAAVPAGPAAAAEAKPRIDVVFCIDCSGSMGGVIETAKQKVWAIVNEVARAKPSPVLRIGLLGYGNADQTWRSFPLTDDLDQVYKDLVTFRDEGWGDEFVGMAVHKAANEMQWSEAGPDGKQVLKVIYVVGNETARQGPEQFDFTKTAPAAIAKGIQVNAIYCGDVDYAQATPTWREMAKLADGQYMEIAAQGGAVVIATPFDEAINELGVELNATYVAYGGEGKDGALRQVAADSETAEVGGDAAGADRAVAKSSKQYRNARWDLVDASKEDGFKWEDVAKEDLPEELRELSEAELKEYVEKKAEEREEIQEEIRKLADKRAEYIRAEAEKQGLTEEDSFDLAVRESIEEQAAEKGFTFEE